MNAKAAGNSMNQAPGFHRELENTRTAFHTALDQISDLDLYLPSRNPHWTIGDVLYHIIYGVKFIPLEVPILQKGLWYPLPSPALFDWLNPVATRLVSRIYDRQLILNQYDRAHAQVLKTLGSVKEDQWSLGRNYPELDPPVLGGYVTIEDLFHYPKAHFNQHMQDIQEGLERAERTIERAQKQRQREHPRPPQAKPEGLMSYPTQGWHKAIFKAPLFFWRLGLGPLLGGYLMLITHTGRKTGLPRRTMVEYHAVGNRKYAPCAFGPRADWFKNIANNPRVTIQSSSGAENVRAVRVEDDRELMAVYYRFRRRDPPLTKWYLESIGIQDDPLDVLTKKDRVYWLRFDPIQEETPAPLKSDLAWIWPLLGISLLGYWIFRRLRRKPS